MPPPYRYIHNQSFSTTMTKATPTDGSELMVCNSTFFSSQVKAHALFESQHSVPKH